MGDPGSSPGPTVVGVAQQEESRFTCSGVSQRLTPLSVQDELLSFSGVIEISDGGRPVVETPPTLELASPCRRRQLLAQLPGYYAAGDVFLTEGMRCP